MTPRKKFFGWFKTALLILAVDTPVAAAPFFVLGEPAAKGEYLVCKAVNEKLIPGIAQGQAGEGWRSIASQIELVARDPKLSRAARRKKISRLRALAELARKSCSSRLRVLALAGQWYTKYSCERMLTERCEESITLTFDGKGAYHIVLKGGRVCYLGPAGKYWRQVVAHRVEVSGAYAVTEDSKLVLTQAHYRAVWDDCPLFSSEPVQSIEENSDGSVLSFPLELNLQNKELWLHGACPLFSGGLYFCEDQIEPYRRTS